MSFVRIVICDSNLTFLTPFIRLTIHYAINTILELNVYDQHKPSKELIMRQSQVCGNIDAQHDLGFNTSHSTCLAHGRPARVKLSSVSSVRWEAFQFWLSVETCPMRVCRMLFCRACGASAKQPRTGLTWLPVAAFNLRLRLELLLRNINSPPLESSET